MQASVWETFRPLEVPDETLHSVFQFLSHRETTDAFVALRPMMDCKKFPVSVPCSLLLHSDQGENYESFSCLLARSHLQMDKTTNEYRVVRELPCDYTNPLSCICQIESFMETHRNGVFSTLIIQLGLFADRVTDEYKALFDTIENIFTHLHHLDHIVLVMGDDICLDYRISQKPLVPKVLQLIKRDLFRCHSCHLSSIFRIFVDRYSWSDDFLHRILIPMNAPSHLDLLNQWMKKQNSHKIVWFVSPFYPMTDNKLYRFAETHSHYIRLDTTIETDSLEVSLSHHLNFSNHSTLYDIDINADDPEMTVTLPSGTLTDVSSLPCNTTLRQLRLVNEKMPFQFLKGLSTTYWSQLVHLELDLGPYEENSLHSSSICLFSGIFPRLLTLHLTRIDPRLTLDLSLLPSHPLHRVTLTDCEGLLHLAHPPNQLAVISDVTFLTNVLLASPQLTLTVDCPSQLARWPFLLGTSEENPLKNTLLPLPLQQLTLTSLMTFLDDDDEEDENELDGPSVMRYMYDQPTLTSLTLNGLLVTLYGDRLPVLQSLSIIVCHVMIASRFEQLDTLKMQSSRVCGPSFLDAPVLRHLLLRSNSSMSLMEVSSTTGMLLEEVTLDEPIVSHWPLFQCSLITQTVRRKRESEEIPVWRCIEAHLALSIQKSEEEENHSVESDDSSSAILSSWTVPDMPRVQRLSMRVTGNGRNEAILSGNRPCLVHLSLSKSVRIDSEAKMDKLQYLVLTGDWNDREIDNYIDAYHKVASSTPSLKWLYFEEMKRAVYVGPERKETLATATPRIIARSPIPSIFSPWSPSLNCDTIQLSPLLMPLPSSKMREIDEPEWIDEVKEEDPVIIRHPIEEGCRLCTC